MDVELGGGGRTQEPRPRGTEPRLEGATCRCGADTAAQGPRKPLGVLT